VPEVRLVGEDGSQIGVLATAEALRYAQERDLDLVEVAPEARPPVCRALDYSKYKYEQAQKQKQARRHQQQITIREIKFRPKIAQHDYETKKGHVERFLRHKDKVKITIMFRGREVTHPERGSAILNRVAEELSELAVIEQHPIQDGRNMTMLLAPSRAVMADQVDGEGAPVDGEGAEAEPAADQAQDATKAGGEDATKAGGEDATKAEDEAPAGDQPSGILAGDDAKDEDALGRQEALPQDGDRQAPRPAPVHESHPREEVT
jgi:translation initiation factor IF-3